jgi:SNF2 family DNA or RNA helicase
MSLLTAQGDIFALELHSAARADVPPDEAFARASALTAGLFPHQVEGVAFLLGRRRAILADDMGLGKTRQAIVALRHAAPGGPFLVICPASVKRNWAREILGDPNRDRCGTRLHVVVTVPDRSGREWFSRSPPP